MKLIIMMGIPGCGKSTTVRKKLSENEDMIIVSKDDIRTMFFGEYGFRQEVEDLVKESCNSMVAYALARGLSVILDETNISIKKRDYYYNLGKKFGAEVELVYVDTPTDICIERRSVENRTYSAGVWKEVINFHFENIELPDQIEIDRYDNYEHVLGY